LEIVRLSVMNIPENLKPEGRTLNFDFSSRELKNEITKYISVIETERPRNSQDTSNLRIVLIGHSAGGIVIRHALVIDYIDYDEIELDDYDEIELDDDIITSLKNIILIASPSEGTPLVPEWIDRVARPFFMRFLTAQTLQLGFRSQFIRVLNRRWVNFVRNQLEENTVCHLYAQSDPIAPPPELYSIDRQPIIIIENADHNGILRDYRTHQHIQNLLAE